MPKTTDTPINTRKALAGIGLLEGKVLKQALIDGGYSPATARIPAQAGLSAKSCIEEAKKLDPSLDPATLLRKARRAFGKKLDQINTNDKILTATRGGEIARMVDISERYYGPHSDEGGLDPRIWADRTDWMMRALSELKRRQLARDEVQHVVE